MKWQWLVGIGAMAGIGAVGLWLTKKLHREDGIRTSEDDWKKNDDNSQKKNEQDGQGQGSPNLKTEDTSVQEKSLCKAELERFGGKFEDLYEPLRQTAEQSGYRVDEGDLAFSWEARLEDDERLHHLYRKWQSMEEYSDREKLEKWYYFLLSLGVSCSTEQSVVLDEKVMKKYDFVDDWKPYIGQKLQVKNGYWYLGNAILEKGNLVMSGEMQEV